jgi:hypothetical protein
MGSLLRAGIVAALVAVATLPLSPVADASCIGPSVAATPNHAAPGEQIRLKGGPWADRCNDTISCTPDGCEKPEPAKPAKNIVLHLRMGEKDWSLWIGDAEENFAIDKVVTIPNDVPPGKARIDWVHEPFTVDPAPLATPDPTPKPTIAPTPEPTDEVQVLGITETRNTRGGGAGLLVALGAAVLILGSGLGIRRSSRAR